ncbi:MAG TPA: GNAT family N-acetyltransferase [Armatimonadota bacterium]|jgi:CelD/BcsL family acetyltransferase involved in cellulose biosynthesis|nr:GNAT family N-acetyltransferase [Armatimonadota bacterium]HOM81659.1 GNAT family N-acetyltransferase [Armatimonadota bacterium]HPO71502.1 GNAT family N-acetyltransferase [Armatimonadota bacterium]HPT98807.1 GNAT family N-acetyltransferase [Armatimonadota bacterium]
MRQEQPGSETADPAGRVEIIEEPRRLEAISTAWDQLAEKDPRAHVFQGCPWLSTWLRHYPRARPFLLVFWRDDEMTAALPLCAYDLGRGWCRMRTLRFIADNNSDYCDALSDPDHPNDLGVLWEHLTRRKDWHLLDLRYLPEGSQVATLSHAAGQRFWSLRQRLDAAPYIDLRTDWRERVPRNHRTEVLRRWRRVQEQGQVTFEIARTPEEADMMLDQLARMHIARWQGRHETSVFHFADYRRWVHDVCHELLKRDQLYLCRLSLDGRPMSMALAFLQSRRLLRYTSTFDEAYSRFGPVHLLLMAVVEDLRANNIADVHEFGRGWEAYKARWTHQAHAIERILVARVSAVGLAAFWWAGHLKPFVWNHERLGTLLREGRRRATLLLKRRS